MWVFFWLPCCCDSSHFQTHHSDEADPHPVPMYPHGNVLAAIDEYMGVDCQYAKEEEGQITPHCICQTPPPLPDWFMTELSPLLSLSLSSLALCDGGDPCKWSWCPVRKFPNAQTAAHSWNRTALRLLLHSVLIRLLLTNPADALQKLTLPENEKSTSVLFVFFSFTYVLAVKQSVFIFYFLNTNIVVLYACVVDVLVLITIAFFFSSPLSFGMSVLVWLPRRRRLRWLVFRVHLRRRRRAPSAWATWLGSSTFWSEDSVWPCWWPWLSSVTSPEPRPNEWRWQRMHRTLTQLPRRIHRILQLIRKVTTYMESKV